MGPKVLKHFSLFMFFAFTLALLNSLIGCGPVSQVYPKVISADAQILSKCKYLGKVSGSSGEYIVSQWRTKTASDEIQINNAKVCALQAAADLGATHVVWDEEKELRKVDYITARAYKCE